MWFCKPQVGVLTPCPVVVRVFFFRFLFLSFFNRYRKRVEGVSIIFNLLIDLSVHLHMVWFILTGDVFLSFFSSYKLSTLLLFTSPYITGFIFFVSIFSFFFHF